MDKFTKLDIKDMFSRPIAASLIQVLTNRIHYDLVQVRRDTVQFKGVLSSFRQFNTNDCISLFEKVTTNPICENARTRRLQLAILDRLYLIKEM